MSTTTAPVSVLAAHRRRMSTLLFAPGDRGHKSTSWYQWTYLDVDDDFTIVNMYVYLLHLQHQ